MNMKTLAAASAAFGLLASASAANAAITISGIEEGNLFGPLAAGQGQIIYDFDSIADPNVAYVGDVLQGPQTGSTSASPPFGGSQTGDETKYASVQGGGMGTFSTLPGFYLSTFSFYLGSPDVFNTLTFKMLDGTSKTFNGKYIWGGSPPGDGNRNNGYRVYYDFGGAKVTSVVFTSTRDAFEFDGIGGNVAAIPEPGTWALMIMGFGGAGAMLRRRKAALA